MRKLSQDQLEEELFLKMLSDSRLGKGELFDLQALCILLNIDTTPEQLIAFAKDNDPDFGRRDIAMKRIGFRISAAGLRHAASLKESRSGPLKKELSSTPTDWSKWGAILTGAGIIVAILIAVAI